MSVNVMPSALFFFLKIALAVLCLCGSIQFLDFAVVAVQSPNQLWHFVTPQTSARQASLSSPSPGVGSNSRPLSWKCHPTISSSTTLFSSCLQSFPAAGSFPVSQLFTSGSQSIRASASVSIVPKNIQGWSPLGLTGLISCQSNHYYLYSVTFGFSLSLLFQFLEV